jgi:hypothetical protein
MHDNPWLNINNKFYRTNIAKLIVLQRFIKRYLKSRAFKLYTNSKQFKEWFYHPNNFGGYKHKLRTNHFFKSLNKQHT